MASDRIRTGPRGFTLIEVLMASAMIIVLAGFISVKFSRYLAYTSLKDAAGQFHQLILFAQEKSVVDGNPVKIEIDSLGTSYRLMEQAPLPGPDEKPAFVPVAGRFGQQESLPEGIECVGPGNEIRCFPDGTCLSGVWRMRKPGGAIYEITIVENPAGITLQEVPF